jgi:hypothetical protein
LSSSSSSSSSSSFFFFSLMFIPSIIIAPRHPKHNPNLTKSSQINEKVGFFSLFTFLPLLRYPTVHPGSADWSLAAPTASGWVPRPVPA